MSEPAAGRAARAGFDVAIVGASLAGCATATLLGRAGLRVALIDKHSDASAYKRLCGHFLQASATPMLERLGLAEPIEAAGGMRNGIEICTRWGMIGTPGTLGERPHGYSIRRLKLDPMIREIALATPGVEYMPGHKAVALAGDPATGEGGVELSDRRGDRVVVGARLVVGADGRNSVVARLAGARERRSRNTRFCYASYFSGVGLPDSPGGRYWMFGHDLAIAAPNDDGLTVLGVFLDKKRHLERFRADRAGALHEFFAALPGPPELASAKREDKVQGYVDYEVIARDPIPQPAVALVGDAALTSDPAMAIGCGWALQAAGWLADSVAPALAGGEPLGPALRRYRGERRRNLGGHDRMIAFDACVRRMNPVQSLLTEAAVSDPETARTLLGFAERTIPARSTFAPATLARAWRVRAAARR